MRLLDFQERQLLKDLEDELLDILLVFDSLYNTIQALLRHYNQFCLASEVESKNDAFDYISDALSEKSEDVVLNRKKIQSLHTKVKGTIELVSSGLSCVGDPQVTTWTQLSNLLDLGNGFSLKQLAEEAKNENTTIRKLAEKSTGDAAAVKVLTIITLIYLPATVVSVSIAVEIFRSS